MFSAPIEVYYSTGFFISLYWQGDPVGYFCIQATSSDFKNIENAVWQEIPDSRINVKGSGGKFGLNVSYVQYRFIRLVYVRASGSGNVDAEFIGKGV